MKELVAEVSVSVTNEYARAVAIHGEANSSLHESYAIILEEYEEVQEQCKAFEFQFGEFWTDVKLNNPELAISRLDGMRKTAEQAAAEWIQVAAMCYKASLEKADSENPKPLTLEQLRRMEGEPVWVELISSVKLPYLPKWCISEFYNIVDDDNAFLYECFRMTSGRGARVEDYGKTWRAYAHKPRLE